MSNWHLSFICFRHFNIICFLQLPAPFPKVSPKGYIFFWFTLLKPSLSQFMLFSCKSTFLLIEFSKHKGFLFIIIFKSQNAPGKFLSSHTSHSVPSHKLFKLMQGKRHFPSHPLIDTVWVRAYCHISGSSLGVQPSQWFHAILTPQGSIFWNAAPRKYWMGPNPTQTSYQ